MRKLLHNHSEDRLEKERERKKNIARRERELNKTSLIEVRRLFGFRPLA